MQSNRHRGLVAEARALLQEGLSKNTQWLACIDPKTGMPGGTIPDGVRANALLLMAGMLFAARGRASTIKDLSELEGRTHPVDLAAFRNLIAPQEEQFLRDALPRRLFRKVQRERMRAALAHVGNVAQNAAIVLRLGESAQNDSRPEIAKVGRELSEQALRLRMLAAMAAIKISVRILIPELRLSPAIVMDAYCQLSSPVMQLCRHQMPGNVSRVVAAL